MTHNLPNKRTSRDVCASMRNMEFLCHMSIGTRTYPYMIVVPRAWRSKVRAPIVMAHHKWSRGTGDTAARLAR